MTVLRKRSIDSGKLPGVSLSPSPSPRFVLRKNSPPVSSQTSAPSFSSISSFQTEKWTAVSSVSDSLALLRLLPDSNRFPLYEKDFGNVYEVGGFGVNLEDLVSLFGWISPPPSPRKYSTYAVKIQLIWEFCRPIDPSCVVCFELLRAERVLATNEYPDENDLQIL